MPSDYTYNVSYTYQSVSNAFPSADEMGSKDYWLSLFPDFHITDKPFLAAKFEHSLPREEADKLSRQVKKEGYFQSAPVLSKDEIEPLAHAISCIHQARMLPVFIAMYDEFWQMLRGLRSTLSPILGESYRLTTDFWAWHISPGAASRGWEVHRDASLDKAFDKDAYMYLDGRPRLCTVWIPLTDAMPHNSCIYVLPFPHDPAIQSFLRGESLDVMMKQSQYTNWTNIRALPASAGSILGWTPYILHWGSQSTDWATHPRISIGLYSESADINTAAGLPFDLDGRRHIDLHDVDFQISFEQRLRIVANILSVYFDNGQFANEPNYTPAVEEFFRRWGVAHVGV